MIQVFIGYDPKESAAYHVCVNSIIRQSSEPVSITPLALNNFSKFYAEWHKDGSNDFIYTRFLVPCLMDYVGHGIYLDGDMLLCGDIAELWALRDYSKGVQVVKHDYKTKAKRKYLGAKNEDYPRKNWSSVILWNSGHYGNRGLLPDFVMAMSGAELHRFSWLKDEWIGELPKEWNWLETEYEPNKDAKLIHYTLGAPCFKAYSKTDTSGQWLSELRNSLTPIYLRD